MPPAPSPAASPAPSTGAGTGTGTSTQQTSSPSQSTTLISSDEERGGVEVPGQPACYKPTKNITERKMYNEARPACAGEQQ